ncbi:MAG: hypothetical protein M0T74_00600 [Desulfitobacterium hafniense]|nr:hypothetical protein [Desulfitobacterium hafniense]
MSAQEEVLKFIKEFETNSRDYLMSKGFSEFEIPNAYLELQWDFLHAILKKHKNNKITRQKTSLVKRPRVSA